MPKPRKAQRSALTEMERSTARITAADPPVIPNVCAECGGPRPKPRIKGPAANPFHETPKTAHKVNHETAAAAAADPFCSSPCCRKFYGVPDDKPAPPKRTTMGPMYEGWERRKRRHVSPRRSRAKGA